MTAAHEAAHTVYIVGWGRSGSTLLTAVLGELDGAFAAGELRMLWGRGAIGRRLCGCGREIPECHVWSQVLERLEDAPCTAEEMAAQAESLQQLTSFFNVGHEEPPQRKPLLRVQGGFRRF